MAPAADPAPLGLAAFALTTFLLSAANAGWMTKATGDAWLGFAFACGGVAQLLAGMWEFRNRNVSGATAFGTYGSFWIGAGAVGPPGRPPPAGAGPLVVAAHAAQATKEWHHQVRWLHRHPDRAGGLVRLGRGRGQRHAWHPAASGRQAVRHGVDGLTKTCR